MNEKTPDWFDICVTRLTASGTQRVWSVLVTIFGDLAQNETDQISGALITSLTSLAGIKAEATRVALHRLRKEGWIESTRIGRNSVHRLTDFGRSQSAAAVPRIYARETVRPDIWHVLVGSGSDLARQELSDLMLTGDYISLNNSTAMAPGPAPDGIEELLVVQSKEISVPNWLKDLCGPKALKDSYDQLWETAQAVKSHLPPNVVSDPMKVAVLRVLLVHSWRRVVLRHPDLPETFLPDDWMGPACREVVSQLLAALPRPSLDALEKALES
ncbi:PaaX family transcriptional regulator C-terminal domain-containing protein [Ruegeria lacuscaerulensis]|uniref:PaaX family transcriptional regulator C-terminal domain-containing protein n=1 Tax=Ruegeria lacuscaerulensis TaxID=55218 RepID=UPI00147CF87F|nr:PaaX family transcriptional regulator C-terminal domain-containing protein [Ruegeria lacuscaerulensis]